MGNKITTEEYKKRAHKIHHNLYDYSLWGNEITTSTRIDTICHIHGIFTQTLDSHLYGKHGCPHCGRIRRKQTKLKRYGNENFTNREKAKITMQDRYGVDHAAQSEQFQDKMKQTKLKRYGNENFTNREKAKITMQDRYGVDNYAQTAECQLKMKQTNQERYGVDNYAQSEQFRDKMKQTNQERYGVNNHAQFHIPEDILRKLNDKIWLIDQHHIKEKTQSMIAIELKVHISTISNYMNKYGIDVKYYTGQSLPEKEVAEYIQTTYNTKVITSVRSIIPPREIDIWIPKYQLAIEFNGKYWHHPDHYVSHKAWKEYHFSKEQECNAKGISLLHLWEEYGNHQSLIDDAVIGIIKNDYIKILNEVYIKGS